VWLRSLQLRSSSMSLVGRQNRKGAWIYGDDFPDVPFRYTDYVTRAERVAVLRAVRSLRRKFPRKIAVCGGEGRVMLRIGKPSAIRRLIQREPWLRPRR
jgi:hypothetical protein